MFVAALRELVETTGAELAIFCDYEGESIALWAPALDDYETRVIGATLAAPVLQLQGIARRYGAGERLSLRIATDARTFLVEALPGGYYVALGLPPRALAAAAQRPLAEVARRFAADL